MLKAKHVLGHGRSITPTADVTLMRQNVERINLQGKKKVTWKIVCCFPLKCPTGNQIVPSSSHALPIFRLMPLPGILVEMATSGGRLRQLHPEGTIIP